MVRFKINENKNMKPNHYVDNEELRSELIAHKARCEENERIGIDPPKINDKLGKMLLLIATRLAYRQNFINYTYRDEMIGDALENMIQYLDRYDPEKSSNAFAYLSQICFFAFVRRIQREKKQTEIKASFVQSHSIDELMDSLGEIDSDISGPTERLLRYYYEYEIQDKKKPKESVEDEAEKLTVIEKLMKKGG